MHHPASLLLALASALTLAGTAVNLVMLTRDEPQQKFGLTWQQKFAARYRRHPRMVPATLACAAVAAVLLIAYNVTLFP